MAQTLAQTALTPTLTSQVPSIAALGAAANADTAAAANASMPTSSGVYIDPATGQLMIPGAAQTGPDGKPTLGPDGKPVTAPATAYDPRIADYTRMRREDPGFFRPDAGGR